MNSPFVVEVSGQAELRGFRLGSRHRRLGLNGPTRAWLGWLGRCARFYARCVRVVVVGYSTLCRARLEHMLDTIVLCCVVLRSTGVILNIENILLVAWFYTCSYFEL